ncbi:NAD(P)-binding protein [Melanogaster broomeanus]|nr:NAD(P)-binding protein [Melanogaster broomeanus]
MGLFSKSFNPLTDLPDISGKVIIVNRWKDTSAKPNNYIALALVMPLSKHLARQGAKVYMAARNKSKAEEAIAKLKEEGLAPGNGEVIWLELDLSDPRNAKRAAEEFLSKEKASWTFSSTMLQCMDCIVYVTYRLVEKYKLSTDGVQDLMVVNAISPFVLTRELLPVLNQTAAGPNADVRIVVVASEGHRNVSGTPRFRNIDDFNSEYKSSIIPSFARYCFSKLANVLYASELQRRLDAEGSPITVVSLDPGAVNTFSRKPQLRRFSWLVEIIVYPIFVHPDVGAYTSAIAAASPEVVQNRNEYRGAYLVPVGKLKQASDTARDEGLAKEMWETIEGFLVEKGI